MYLSVRTRWLFSDRFSSSLRFLCLRSPRWPRSSLRPQAAVEEQGVSYSSSTSVAPLESHYVAKAFRKNCVASLISWYLSLSYLIYFYCFASWNPHWASLFYFCCCSEDWEEAARYTDFLCFSVCFQSFIYFFYSFFLVLPFLLPKMILVICYVSWHRVACKTTHKGVSLLQLKDRCLTHLQRDSSAYIFGLLLGF